MVRMNRSFPGGWSYTTVMLQWLTTAGSVGEKKMGRLTNFEKLQVIGFEELSYLRAKLPSFQIATGSLNVQQSINATNFQR